jgi:hypothetical protein
MRIRRRINPEAWKYFSRRKNVSFFFVNNAVMLYSVVDTMRPPSRAGNGRRFTTQRLIDRSAIMRKMREAGADISTS